MTVLPLPTGPGWDLFLRYHVMQAAIRHEAPPSAWSVAALWNTHTARGQRLWVNLHETMDRASRTTIAADLRGYAALHTDTTWRDAVYAAAERVER